VLNTYRAERLPVNGKQETFIATLRRVGAEPFKAAANAVRFAKAASTKAETDLAEQAA